MRRVLSLPLAAGLVLWGLAGSSRAVDIDDYHLNFTEAAIARGIAPGDLASLEIEDLVGVDEWNFNARAFVGFHDNDASGGISTGDTFEDFVAVKIDTFEDLGGFNITPLRYGEGRGRTHQITVLMHMEGVNVTANDYRITTLHYVDFYFDAGDTNAPGLGPTAGVDYPWTPSDFNNIATFSDGIKVETNGALIAAGGDNSGPVLPDGNLDMIFELVDLLQADFGTDEPFEFELKDELGNLYPPNFLLGFVDSNNLLDDNVNVAALAAYFGFDPGIALGGGRFFNGTDYDFGFTTTSEGSFNKRVVPEPATMALLGSGLLGLAGLSRRRKK